MVNYLVKYKPGSMKELPLPDNLIDKLNTIKTFDGGCYIFAEHPGTGKSSAVELIEHEAIQKLGAMKVFKINGSADNKNEVVKDKIRPFVESAGKRLIIIEEADKLTKEMKGTGAQEALKEVISSTIDHVTWILTTNCLSELLPPIRTRGTIIMFEPSKSKIVQLLSKINMAEKLYLDPEYINKVAETTYPNFREAITYLENPAVNTFKEAKAYLVKLYKGEVSLREFERKFGALSLDTLCNILRIECDGSDFEENHYCYIALMAWKTAAYKNTMSRLALLSFIKCIKFDAETVRFAQKLM